MGDRHKGAGGASAPPRKNNSACQNENRAIVSTVMKILSEQKLEVCCNHQKLINCQTSLELQGGQKKGRSQKTKIGHGGGFLKKNP